MNGGASYATKPPPVENPMSATEVPSASHVSRQEVLRRRSQNLKQLTKCYRDHYWALMEDLKIQYRDYYWNHGVSPVVQGNNNDDGKLNRCCASVGCKLTAMVLTSFCHLHILSDSKQRLYKPCDYVIKRLTFLYYEIAFYEAISREDVMYFRNELGVIYFSIGISKRLLIIGVL
uniref:uncharacterized protein LOC105349537 n=1 Tax=Fragaria vesca subsp. vesca TaxID=101020 RepID=UPI0005C9F055|nr:PREDICTED: uncharacterized protein LOC105349537 [Fragaria vesca subsp. vesca]